MVISERAKDKAIRDQQKRDNRRAVALIQILKNIFEEINIESTVPRSVCNLCGCLMFPTDNHCPGCLWMPDVSHRQPLSRVSSQPTRRNNAMAVTEKKTYICKFCKVEVISKTDFRPIMLKQHKPFCRRAYLNWR